MKSISRRQFLARGAAFGAAPALPLALNLAPSAAAAASGDYKALVCIFLYGGNDAFNTVVATDSASWASYVAARSYGSEPIALAPLGAAPKKGGNFHASLGGPLPIGPEHSQGRGFALHPVMTGMRDVFAGGRLAIVSNVGALVQPTKKADYLNGSAPRPQNLFSHNDQQSMWQTLGIEGATLGWGGTFMDAVMGSNSQPIFSAISLYNSSAWLSGVRTHNYRLSTNGTVHIGGTDGKTYRSAAVQSAMLDIIRNNRDGNLIEQDHAAIVGRSIDAEATLSSALPGASSGPWGTSGLAAGQADPKLMYVNPTSGASEINPLALQLQAVARTIAARGAVGMSRQMFFTGLDGFDTHDSMARNHAVALARLSHAMAYFDATLSAMGVSRNVTTFTASDFGRAFLSNGLGADHGWGGHQFVMGAAVNGGDVYGAFPVYGTPDDSGNFNSPDQLNNGALLPTTSIDQYAATLGTWFGVPDADQLNSLKFLHKFDPSVRNLGFMQAA